MKVPVSSRPGQAAALAAQSRNKKHSLCLREEQNRWGRTDGAGRAGSSAPRDSCRNGSTAGAGEGQQGLEQHSGNGASRAEPGAAGEPGKG